MFGTRISPSFIVVSVPTTDTAVMPGGGAWWGCGQDSLGDYYLVTPYWFSAILVGTIAAIPWTRSYNRFSLRTLLIAMTLVAVGLGLIVWLR